jgi:hypothetical protein
MFSMLSLAVSTCVSNDPILIVMHPERRDVLSRSWGRGWTKLQPCLISYQLIMKVPVYVQSLYSWKTASTFILSVPYQQMPGFPNHAAKV